MKLSILTSVLLAATLAQGQAVSGNQAGGLDTFTIPVRTDNSRGASGVPGVTIATQVVQKVSELISDAFESRPAIPTISNVAKRFHRRGYANRREEKLQASKRAVQESEADAQASYLIDRAAPALRFPYGSQKIRGVSLGGWLVIESFIAPSVYESTGNPKIIDEWSFGELQSKSQARSILQKHLNTFVTEDDFRQIASLGLNHVRIPIGYWAFEVGSGEPFTKLNQWDLLKQAALWASKYNLKVLVDLHAVPGSANGYDHGGKKGQNTWASKASYVDRTVNILRTMSQEFSKSKYANSVSAIELVNEPVTDTNVVLDFYKRGYEAVRYPNGRDQPESPLLVVIGDMFKSPAYTNFWKGKFGPPDYEGVSLDTHIYTIFDNDSLRMASKDRIGYYCSLKSKWAAANNNLYQMIGEWTPAFTDCAKGLNGRGTGARYDGTFPGSTRIRSCDPKTGSAKTFSDGYKTLLGKMWEAQVDANEGGSGWIMWTWKTEAGKAEEWSYQKGVQYGWIPRDPTQRPNGIRC